jgi:hypothetical protein
MTIAACYVASEGIVFGSDRSTTVFVPYCGGPIEIAVISHRPSISVGEAQLLHAVLPHSKQLQLLLRTLQSLAGQTKCDGVDEWAEKKPLRWILDKILFGIPWLPQWSSTPFCGRVQN